MGEDRRSRVEEMMLSSSGGNTDNVLALKEEVHGLREELINKENELYKLRSALKEMIPEEQRKLMDFGSQYGNMTNSYVLQTDLTSSQLKNNARRFIDHQKQNEQFYKEESEKMALAAQQSIDTLQRIIDDKNEQIRRKDKIIDELKKQLISNKEEDCLEIQRLNEEVRELRSKRSVDEIMNKSTSKNFFPSKSEDKFKELYKIIDEKEDEIKSLQNKFDKLYLSKFCFYRSKRKDLRKPIDFSPGGEKTESYPRRPRT